MDNCLYKWNRRVAGLTSLLVQMKSQLLLGPPEIPINILPQCSRSLSNCLSRAQVFLFLPTHTPVDVHQQQSTQAAYLSVVTLMLLSMQTSKAVFPRWYIVLDFCGGIFIATMTQWCNVHIVGGYRNVRYLAVQGQNTTLNNCLASCTNFKGPYGLSCH